MKYIMKCIGNYDKMFLVQISQRILEGVLGNRIGKAVPFQGRGNRNLESIF
jgi:hypothetical protein